MSTTIAEPRFLRGPTLPEIAGVIAGILALAIALAPTLANHGRKDAASGTPDGSTLSQVEAASPPSATAAAAPSVDPGLHPGAEGLAASERCGPHAFDGGLPAPGAFCPLPPRQQEPAESRFVDLAFPWPRSKGADER